MPFKTHPLDSRPVPLPVVRSDLWGFYKKLQRNHWMAEDIRDWPQDVRDWSDALSAGQRLLITTILRFLLRGDQIIIENLEHNFVREFPCPEAQLMFAAQTENENTHVETYTLVALNLVGGEAGLAELLHDAGPTPDAVARKEAWAKRWLDDKQPLEARVIAFMCVEGIFFSASFCAIAWFKAKGLLPALGQSNEYILRDEGIHVQMGAALYAACDRPLSYDAIAQIVRAAVEIEKAFARECLPNPVPELSASNLALHIERRADILFELLGLAPLYKTQCPFSHMSTFDAELKTNFFERASTAYAKGYETGPGSSWGGAGAATIDITAAMDF